MPNDTVKIFIGHSTKEFKDNILNLKEFLEELSSSFNASIKVMICEDKTVSGQDEINEKWIKPSDIAFFCFKDKVGDFSKEELEVAVEEYVKNKFHPQVFVYIKQGNTEDSKLQEIIEKLEKNYRIFYFDFDEYAIKLRFAQNVSQSLGGEGKVKAEGRKVFIDDKPINLPVKELSAIKKNDNYSALQAEIKNLRNLRNEAEEEGDQEKYYELSEKINAKIAEQIQLEKDALKIYEYLNNQLKKDNADEDAIKALALATQGKIEEGLALLPIGQLLEQSKTNVKAFNIGKQLTENAKENAKKLIEKLLARIEILTLKINNDGVLQEICDLYEEILNQEDVLQEYNYDLAFSEFLGSHNQIEKAYQIALNYLTKIENLKIDDKVYKQRLLVECYKYLAFYCSFLSKSKESEKFNLKIISIYEKLTKKDFNSYALDLACSYDEYSRLLINLSRGKESEEFLLKSLKIKEQLVEIDRDSYIIHLAHTYQLFADRYLGYTMAKEAEEYYLKAAAIYDELNQKENNSHVALLATCYTGLALVYSHGISIDKSCEYNLKAIEIFEKCVEEDKEAYSFALANCYLTMSATYHTYGDYKNLYEYAKKAVTAFESLCQLDYLTNASFLAGSYAKLGCALNGLGNFSEGEAVYLKAINIQEGLYKIDADDNGHQLATFYAELSQLYLTQNDYVKAEACCTKAVDIFDVFVKRDFESSRPFVANLNRLFAEIYCNTGRLEEAEQLITNALEMYEELSDINSEEYNLLYLDTYRVLVLYKEKQLELNETEDGYSELIDLKEELYNLYPQKYFLDFAKTYYNFAMLYKNKEDYDNCLEQLAEAVDIINKNSNRDKDLNFYIFGAKLYKEVLNNLLITGLTDKVEDIIYVYQMLTEVLVEMDEHAFKNDYIECFEFISHVYAQLKNQEKSNEYQEKAKNLKG